MGANASLLRDGDVWQLRFAGRTAALKHAKGLVDLPTLLRAPETEIAASELAGISADSGSDLVLDDAAKARYRRRLAELDAELDDPVRGEAAESERAAMIDELARASGLGGRRRRLGDTGERARTAVTARIRDTLRRIEAVHPELGRHLSDSVTTGRACSYRPTEPVHWRL